MHPPACAHPTAGRSDAVPTSENVSMSSKQSARCATGSNRQQRTPRLSAKPRIGPGRRCHCHHYYARVVHAQWPCACQWRNGLGRREPASHCPATARRPRPGLRLCRGGDVTVPSLNPPESLRPQARGEPRVAKTAHFKLAATGTRSRRPLSAPVPVTCTRPPALGPGPASPRGPRARRAPGPASRIGRLELAKDTPIIWNRRQSVGHDRALRRSNETGPLSLRAPLVAAARSCLQGSPFSRFL
jgi:hypothetical protein